MPDWIYVALFYVGIALGFWLGWFYYWHLERGRDGRVPNLFEQWKASEAAWQRSVDFYANRLEQREQQLEKITLMLDAHRRQSQAMHRRAQRAEAERDQALEQLADRALRGSTNET